MIGKTGLNLGFPARAQRQLLVAQPLPLRYTGGKMAPGQTNHANDTWSKDPHTARVPAELRETLEQAAQLQGATLNQFVVQSAFQAAQRIVERETLIRLSQRDAQKVFSLLDHPPKPNARLKEAVKASRAKVRV